MTKTYNGQKLHLLTNKAMQDIKQSVRAEFAKAPPWYVEYQRKCAILDFAEAKGIRFNVYKDDKSSKELVLAAASRYICLNQPLAEQYEKACRKTNSP